MTGDDARRAMTARALFDTTKVTEVLLIILDERGENLPLAVPLPDDRINEQREAARLE